ncbi:MAG: hypothetical protein GEU93_08600 [Propionibacteriales bacterium]|nr:hypothetical protein [Propionibacteriales bacterium]
MRADLGEPAGALEQLLSDAEDTSGGPDHGLTGVRMLLARCYYHSAQLGRTEAAARRLLAEDPTDAYAALLLARTLQRGSRHDEARLST